jgi:hypothetical protein
VVVEQLEARETALYQVYICYGISHFVDEVLRKVTYAYSPLINEAYSLPR